jgi:hypothetical protein
VRERIEEIEVLRFIVQRKIAHHNGLQTENLETLDADCPALENILRRGGLGESSYDYSELLGVEVMEQP